MRYWPLIFGFFAAACSPPPSSDCERPDGEAYDHCLMGKTPGNLVESGSPDNIPVVLPESLSIEAGQAESPDGVEAPAIRLSPAEHDFGTVKAGEELKLTLEVVRPAGTPLRLGRVMASCTCVTVSAPKRMFAIDENEPAKVHTTLRTDKLAGVNSFIVSVELLEPVKAIFQSNLLLTVWN